jgi:hypothetical protein
MNADLLLLPDHALGTWLDGLCNLHVLDVVVCPRLLSEANSLGRENKQEAIFDLHAGKVIPLAATNACLEDLGGYSI